MLNVILLRAEKPGNIGAIARVMKNFDLDKLILVNPQCNHLSKEARNRAKHAQDVLENAKVLKKIHKMDYLIATSAKRGSMYNPRSPLTPNEVAKKIPKNCNVGLLIGPEGKGLSNKEILDADFLVTIPASKKYGTLNVSHACAILFYEFFGKGQILQEPASPIDKKELVKLVHKKINKMKFATKEKKATQKIVWKRLLSKAFLTKREAFVLFGFFKKVK